MGRTVALFSFVNSLYNIQQHYARGLGCTCSMPVFTIQYVCVLGIGNVLHMVILFFRVPSGNIAEEFESIICNTYIYSPHTFDLR